MESYWILNNYGSPDFSALNEIKFKPLIGEPIGAFEDFKLHVRSENEDLNNWEYLCDANDFVGGTFNFNHTCNIMNSHQFFIEAQSPIVAIEENSFGENFKIYPNPVRDKVYVSLGEQHGNIVISLITIDGKLISNIDFKQNTDLIEFELPGSAGVYFVKITSASTAVAIVKLIKL